MKTKTRADLRVITDPIITEEEELPGCLHNTRRDDEKLIERRLVQQERISAIGEIAAGIARGRHTAQYYLGKRRISFARKNGEE